jgi:hypothetical protein
MNSRLRACRHETRLRGFYIPRGLWPQGAVSTASLVEGFLSADRHDC